MKVKICFSIVFLILLTVSFAQAQVLGIPTNLVVTPIHTGGMIQFTAPTNIGGSAITNYEYSTDNGATWVTPSPLVTESPLIISSGLTNCTTYPIKLRAVNASGSGAASATVNLTPAASVNMGINCTSRTSATDNGWRGITYGSGVFVTVSEDGTGNRVMTSPDGITWAVRTSSADNQWQSVTYGNGQFVAVANTGSSNRVMTSSFSVAANAPLITSAIFGGSTVVNFTQSSAALALSITNYDYSSDNGSTWTEVSPAQTTSPLTIIGFSGGSIMIRAVNSVGNSCPSNKYCAPSTSKSNVSICQSVLPYNWNGTAHNAAGTYTYTTSNSQGCDSVATLYLTVTPNNTAGPTSSTPILCINSTLTNIALDTTGAKGIGTPTGLLAGVSAAWAADVITISDTPTASGAFPYSIPLSGGCGAVNATGTITVTPNNTITRTSAIGTDVQTVCIGVPITTITYATTGAIGATFTNLPTGVTGSWAANVVTISGTPTVAGTALTYTVTITGGCGSVNATGTITVNALISNSCAAFITRWNLATAGSGATQLSFGTATSGTVNYYWQEVSPGSATGSGSLSGSTLTITGLPTGATIRLGIYPTNFQRININNGTDRSRLLDVEQWGATVWTSMATAFYGCNNLNITATDLPVLTSCTSMANMFQSCSILNGPANINSWNTTAVNSMQNMFTSATSFNQNIGSWNTAAVTNLVVTPINTGGIIRLSTTTSFVSTSVRPSPAISESTLLISSGLANYTAYQIK